MSPTSTQVTPELTAGYLPYALPWIGQEEIDAVIDCLRSGWITTGPRARQFESEFAEYVNVRHAVAVNSCTAALHLALEACGVGPGDEVLLPTMTFAATAEVICYLGARPVFVDSSEDTLNLDVRQAASYLDQNGVNDGECLRNRNTGSRIRAIIPVHFAGLPCDMDSILSLARLYRLRVIEDAAHALPAYVHGRSVGSLGDAAAFSFYATKSITTAEGGMLTTNDDAIANRARMMSLHGISKDAWLRYTAQGSWYYEILASGYKYNMTDIAAAIGLVQLTRCDDLWRIRRSHASRYTAAFADTPEIQTPVQADPGYEHAWHLYPIRLDLDRLRIDRGCFVDLLRQRDIGVSVHFMPLHLHPFYRDCYNYSPDDYPVASQAYNRLISLPLYPRMAEADVDRVADAVNDIVRQSRR